VRRTRHQQIAAATSAEAATTRVRAKTQIYDNFLAKEKHKFSSDLANFLAKEN